MDYESILNDGRNFLIGGVVLGLVTGAGLGAGVATLFFAAKQQTESCPPRSDASLNPKGAFVANLQK